MLNDKILDAVKHLPASSPFIGKDGGFAGTFYRKDGEVAFFSVDGVGTKAIAAAHFKDDYTYRYIGRDAVAMNVNDVLAQGGTPRAIMIYYASADDHPNRVFTQVMKGVSEACKESGCELIGGETAKMPGMYEPPLFDVVGFAYGEGRILKGHRKGGIKAGDLVYGVRSSGFHANGFTKIRPHLVKDDTDLTVISHNRWVLSPTTIYSDFVKKLREYYISAAHITGGGLVRNLPRLLGDSTVLSIKVNLGGWQWGSKYNWLYSKHPVSSLEMAKHFNCGIGFAVIVPKERQYEFLVEAYKMPKIPTDIPGEEVDRIVNIGEVVINPEAPVTFEGYELADALLKRAR